MYKTPFDIIVEPLFSEKAEAQSKLRKYTFLCRIDATKSEIKRAVESMFGVKVAKVNTMIYRGKLKRRGIFIGKRPNFKKAIVSLKEGSIDFTKITEKLAQKVEKK